MRVIIRSALGAVAGIFLMLALFQILLTVPEFKSFMTELVNGIVTGLLIGAVLAGLIGLYLLYVSIKGRF